MSNPAGVTQKQMQRVNHIHSHPETFIGLISISHDHNRAQLLHPKTENMAKVTGGKRKTQSVTAQIRTAMQNSEL